MDYLDKARLLKKAGFVDYDLRRNLTQAQKGVITKAWNKNSAVITHADNFVSRKVAPKTADKMKRDGYTVNKKGRVFVQLEGYEKVQIKSHAKTGGRDITVIRATGNKKSVTKVLVGKELVDALENFDDKKLKKNQFVTIRIGDNAAFKQSYKGKALLMNYIKNSFNPKDKGTDKDYLISQMSIVTIEGARPATYGRKSKKGRTKYRTGKSK